MVKVLEYVDFIKKHSLFVIIHMRFSQNFHSWLGTTFSVYTDSDFTKCSWTEHLSNSVMVPQFASVLHDKVWSFNLNVIHLNICCYIGWLELIYDFTLYLNINMNNND
jgi:hypothetical protein